MPNKLSYIFIILIIALPLESKGSTIGFVSIADPTMKVIESYKTNFGDRDLDIDVPEWDMDKTINKIFHKTGKERFNLNLEDVSKYSATKEPFFYFDGEMTKTAKDLISKISNSNGPKDILIMVRESVSVFTPDYYSRGQPHSVTLEGYGILLRQGSFSFNTKVFVSGKFYRVNVASGKVEGVASIAHEEPIMLYKAYDNGFKKIIYDFVTEGTYSKKILDEYKRIIYSKNFTEGGREKLLKYYTKDIGDIDDSEERFEKLEIMLTNRYGRLDDFRYMHQQVKDEIKEKIDLALIELSYKAIEKLFSGYKN